MFIKDPQHQFLTKYFEKFVLCNSKTFDAYITVLLLTF